MTFVAFFTFFMVLYIAGFIIYVNSILLHFLVNNINNFFIALVCFYDYGALPEEVEDLFLKSLILIPFFSFFILLNFQIFMRALLICQIDRFF